MHPSRFRIFMPVGMDKQHDEALFNDKIKIQTDDAWVMFCSGRQMVQTKPTKILFPMIQRRQLV
jgi:hypothetical protein